MRVLAQPEQPGRAVTAFADRQAGGNLANHLMLAEVAEQHIARHFSRVELPPVAVSLRQTPVHGHPHALAVYRPALPRRGATITVDPAVLDGTHPHVDGTAPYAGRWALVEDLVLHELVHHVVESRAQQPALVRDHGPAFQAVAGHVARNLDLPPCTASPGGPELWPAATRPLNHYQGALRLHPALHQLRLLEELDQ